MSTKSLWLFLLVLLGGFFFSTAAYSGTRVNDGQYGHRIDYCGSDVYDATAAYGIFWANALTSGTSRSHVFTGVTEAYKFSYSRKNLDGTTSDRTQSVPNQAKKGGCDESTFNNEFDPQQELEGQCMNDFDGRSYWYSDNYQDGCFQEQSGGDSDSDGVINELDPDSGLYDPNFCTDNPSHSDCSDGGDGSGGDGDGSGGDGDGDGGGTGWEPPTGSECQYSTDSQQCCNLYAQDYCSAFGGVYDAAYNSIGGQSCNVTCNDDLIEPDPDPDPDPNPDNSDLLNAVNDASNNIASQIANSEAAITGQIAQQTDELGADINSLESTNQSGFDALNNTNQTGFTALADELAAIKNNTADTTDPVSQGLLDEIAENSSHLEQIEFNTRQLGSIGLELSNQSQVLDGINSGVGSLNDSLDGFLNPDSPVPDGDDFGADDFGGALAGDGIGDELENRFGDMPGIPNEVVDLSKPSEDFSPILQDVDSACPEPEVMDFGVTKVTLSWGPFCDLFSLLGVLVIASASLAVPFIILGVSKR